MVGLIVWDFLKQIFYILFFLLITVIANIIFYFKMDNEYKDIIKKHEIVIEKYELKIKSFQTIPPCHEEYKKGDLVDKCYVERD